jgi:hypothetical protein
VPDATDNCVSVFNPTQFNSDAFYENGPDIPGTDDTVPTSDLLGNACDEDDDNDGLLDVADGPTLASCGAFDGTPAGHPLPDGGDYGSADGDGPSWDTDDDAVFDGAECLAGTNPRAPDSGDRAACAQLAGGALQDTDVDGLLDAWEVCKWGSDPADDNTDGEGAGDCQEAFDLNGFAGANQTDATFVYRAVFDLMVGDWSFDVNGNGQITSGDAVFIQQAFFGLRPCL